MLIFTCLVLVFAILISCETGTYVSVPTTRLEHLRNIHIEQVDYDTVNISSNEDFIVNSKDIEYVILGQKEDFIFTGQDTVIPQYWHHKGGYSVQFSFHKDVDLSEIKYDFTLRYLLNNSSWVELDTFALMYKWPYESAIVFLTPHLMDLSEMSFQDFDLNKEYLFFRPFGGSQGLYQYKFDSKLTRGLLEPLSGNHITSDSIYVFYDNGRDICRYNLMTHSTDLQLELGAPSGIDVYHGNLYVFLRGTDSPLILARFDLDPFFAG